MFLIAIQCCMIHANESYRVETKLRVQIEGPHLQDHIGCINCTLHISLPMLISPIGSILAEINQTALDTTINRTITT